LNNKDGDIEFEKEKFNFSDRKFDFENKKVYALHSVGRIIIFDLNDINSFKRA
jgi:hypothetical protein